MALPKGGLVSDHVLVLPIGHYAATTESPEVCMYVCMHVVVCFIKGVWSHDSPIHQGVCLI